MFMVLFDLLRLPMHLTHRKTEIFRRQIRVSIYLGNRILPGIMLKMRNSFDMNYGNSGTSTTKATAANKSTDHSEAKLTSLSF